MEAWRRCWGFNTIPLWLWNRNKILWQCIILACLVWVIGLTTSRCLWLFYAELLHHCLLQLFQHRLSPGAALHVAARLNLQVWQFVCKSAAAGPLIRQLLESPVAPQFTLHQQSVFTWLVLLREMTWLLSAANISHTPTPTHARGQTHTHIRFQIKLWGGTGKQTKATNVHLKVSKKNNDRLNVSVDHL